MKKQAAGAAEQGVQAASEPAVGLYGALWGNAKVAEPRLEKDPRRSATERVGRLLKFGEGTDGRY